VLPSPKPRVCGKREQTAERAKSKQKATGAKEDHGVELRRI